jgi:hypothetical protein
VVDVEVSAPEMSVLVDEDNSAAADEMTPPDQDALGMMLLLMNVLRPAHESSRPVGSFAASVARVAPECVIDTHGAIVIVSFARNWQRFINWPRTQKCYIGCLRVEKRAVVQQRIKCVNRPSRVRHEGNMLNIESAQQGWNCF